MVIAEESMQLSESWKNLIPEQIVLVPTSYNRHNAHQI